MTTAVRVAARLRPDAGPGARRATGVLYPVGITLSPAVGPLPMSASSVGIAINTMTLRRVKLS